MTPSITRTIALTGATGFLGRHLLKALLEAGYTGIRCLSRASGPPDPDGRTIWVRGDLRDPFSLEDLLEGADTVIHAGGLVSYRLLDKARLFEINARGTANLVNAALHQGVRHVLHMSSTLALGMAPTVRPRDEDSEWSRHRHNTPYAESKYQAELEIWRGREEGLAVTVLLPALILDPAGKEAYSRLLLDWVARGHDYYPPGRSGVVDLRDVVRFTLDGLERGPAGERIILHGGNVRFQDLLAQLAGCLGKSGPNRPLPPALARLTAWWNKWTRGLGLHPQEVMLAFQDLATDAGRSRDKYGFTYTPLADTLRDMATSFRQTI